MPGTYWSSWLAHGEFVGSFSRYARKRDCFLEKKPSRQVFKIRFFHESVGSSPSTGTIAFSQEIFFFPNWTTTKADHLILLCYSAKVTCGDMWWHMVTHKHGEFVGSFRFCDMRESSKKTFLNFFANKCWRWMYTCVHLAADGDRTPRLPLTKPNDKER